MGTDTATIAAVNNDADEMDRMVTGMLANSQGARAVTWTTLTDDDTRGVTLSGSTLTVQENMTGTSTVVLDSSPVDGAVTSADAVVATVNTGGSPASRGLVFTAGNWATSQTVTVRLPADPLIEGTEATVEGRIEDDTERAHQRSLGMVLAGVGRTLAPDAVDVIGDRFQRQPTRNQVTVGGQALTLDRDPQTRRWRQATGAAYGGARALGVEVCSPLGRATGSSDTCTGRRGAR